MDLPLSHAALPLLETVAEIGSTNTELVARERLAAQPHGTVLATVNQTAGKGRLGRVWQAPAGSALAVSIVLKHERFQGFGAAYGDTVSRALGWLPLLGGLAARAAVGAELPAATGTYIGLKWPNDVLVAAGAAAPRKISGVLTELVSETGAVILGIGINTLLRSEQSPTLSATSILMELEDAEQRETLPSHPQSSRPRPSGAHAEPRTLGGALPDTDLNDRLLLAIVTGVLDRFERLSQTWSAEDSGLQTELDENCLTLGRMVRVDLPGGAQLRGRAVGIDGSGALLIRDTVGAITAVHAGDVTHLRHDLHNGGE